MRYFLDSSILIDMLRGTPWAHTFTDTHEQDELITSTVCVFEVASGVERSHEHALKKNRQALHILLSSLSKVFPFTHKDAMIAGQVYATLTASGQKIDDMDILIAASAMRSKAVLISGNSAHFRRVKDLEVIDPNES